MSALTDNVSNADFRWLDARGGDNGATVSLPLWSSSGVVWQGAAMGWNIFTGKIAPLKTSGQDIQIFCGWATSQKEASPTATNWDVNVSGVQILNAAVAGLTSANYAGDTVYLSTDNYADFTLTWSAGAIAIGRVAAYVSSGVGHVQCFSFEESKALAFDADGNVTVKLLALTLSAESTGDVTGGTSLFTFGGGGAIVDFFAKVTTPTTDSNADATFNLEIGTTNLTGGVITIGDTSDAVGANQAGLSAVYGATVGATKITAANTFSATNTMSVECVVSNAYSDGAIELYAKFSAA